MSREVQPSNWAILKFPRQLRLGPSGFAERCDWQLRTEDGRTLVALGENYRRQQPRLISVREVVDATGDTSALSLLASLPNQDEHLSGIDPSAVSAEVARYQSLGTLGALVATLQLVFMTTPSAALEAQMRHMYEAALRPADDRSRLIMLRFHEPIAFRYAATRALLAAQVAPESLDAPAGEFEGFNSGKALLNAATAGAWPYVAPALLAAAPYVSGVLATRAYADLVWLFDRPLAGNFAPTDNLLSLMSPRGDRFTHPHGLAGVARPDFGSVEGAAFLEWWMQKLNQLFSIITDISLFVTAGGVYDPRRHTALLLSLERLFRDLLDCLSGTGSNEGARLRAAYDFLDCVDGVKLGLLSGQRVATFRHLTTPSEARRALTTLEHELPSTVAQVALPKCREAVAALESVRDGFFLARHTDENGLTNVPQARGGLRNVPWDEAVPDYLRIDRNAAHSLLGEIDPTTQPDKLTTFVAHNGQLPPGIANLPFLWLLLLLSDLTRLRQPLVRSLKRQVRGRPSN